MRPKLSVETIIAAIEDDDGVGFCRSCANEQMGCEPDARNYECDMCGEEQVFGAEELLLMVF